MQIAHQLSALRDVCFTQEDLLVMTVDGFVPMLMSTTCVVKVRVFL